MPQYDVFKAVADKTRRDIYKLISDNNGLTINKISEKFHITRQGITKHLKMLESSGLVRIDAVGRERKCYANKRPLSEINKWISNQLN